MLFLISLAIGLTLGLLIGGAVLLLARGITPTLDPRDALEMETLQQGRPHLI
ncbi:hypothetical protein [Deinococcus roseus]|uniref:Uncharacterized protein n=1 Tax=Deinococcus roseus TaxID=392414 RepID=A0ABQ2DH26_9DEIO|nr:hypothetical protein [Deinococcus roseus]GGJ55384.1 hypothetical protein GCM10008938_46940 [Deinococcus roseus]